MAKRFLFGWATFSQKEDKSKHFKVVNLGASDDFWHGIRFTSPICSDQIVIPDCAPGSVVEVDFNEKGGIEAIELVK